MSVTSALIEACRAKVKRFTSSDIELIGKSKDYLDQSSLLDISHGQKEFRIEEEESDILADQRRTPTIEDDIILILLNSMMENITESCSGKKCMKPVLKPVRPMQYDMVTLKEPTGSADGMVESDSLHQSNRLSVVLNKKSKRKGSADSVTSETEKRNASPRMRTPSILSKHSKTRSSLLKNFRKGGNSKIKQAYKDKSNTKDSSGFQISRVMEETLSMLEDYAKGSLDNSVVLKDIMDLNEMQDHDKKLAAEWRVSFPDEDVVMVFTQGNEYEGRISRKLMEGRGIFTWSDGSSYEGDFTQGEITGRGKMTFSDLSWYDGEFFRGIRHGNGIYVSYDNDIMYTGHWFLGNMHGVGTLSFGDKNNNYYTGEFFNGEFHGYGSRQYPSGARYFGEWWHGVQHGNGTMVFKNFDVYVGNWENGLMNGQGEYIWSAFVNETFTQPVENMYRGGWVNGHRTGCGTLFRSCRANIFGEWFENMKHGAGVIICLDGSIVKGNPLFIGDNLTENLDESDPILNPSVIFPEKLTREITPIPGLRRTGKKPSEFTSKVNIQATVSLCKADNSIHRSRISYETRGNPLKINLHQSKFEITYQALRLLECLEKCPSKIELEMDSDLTSKTCNADVKQVMSSELYKVSDTCRAISSTFLSDNIERESSRYDRGHVGSISSRPEHLMKETSLTNSMKREFSKRQTSFEETTSIKRENTKEKDEPHADRSYEKKSLKETSIPGLDNESKSLMDYEIKWLRKVILLNIYDLRRILKTYTKIATDKTVRHETISLRIMIWQFERDCGFNNRGFSLVDVDERVAQNPDSHVLTVYDPLEKIETYQFLQYLLELSWMLYASKGIGYEGAPGILASAFMKTLHDDIYPNVDNHKGKVLFEYLHLLPLDAVYLLYRNFGEPHTARQFLTKVCVPHGSKLPNPPDKYSMNWYPEHIRNGTNVIYLANNLIYLPQKEPLSFSWKNPKDWYQTPEGNTTFDPYATEPLCLHNLGPKKITEILASVCPGIKSEGLICNMDYKLTFLEFYEVLLKCAEESIIKDKMKVAKASMKETAPSETQVPTEPKKTKGRLTSAKAAKTKKKGK